jgi:hypothetical protein
MTCCETDKIKRRSEKTREGKILPINDICVTSEGPDHVKSCHILWWISK